MLLTPLHEVRPGMMLGVGVHNPDGQTLLGPDVPLTQAYIARLGAMGCSRVWIEDEDTRDIQYDHVLSEDTRLGAGVEIRRAFALVAQEAPVLRSATIDDIRGVIETRRFQRAIEDDVAITGVLAQADAIVRTVLDQQLLPGLGSQRSGDTYHYHHGVDVAVMATLIGRLLGYDRQTLRKLCAASMLHDIGKVLIADALVGRAGKLDPDEARKLSEHTVLGYLLLRDGFQLGVVASHVAYQHHERQDGTGYPRGLTGTNRIPRGTERHVPGTITPFAEIVALADFYDSRTWDRPYRQALPHDQVWRSIKNGAGTQFNREVADLFLSIVPPYPLSTRVVVARGPRQGCTGVVARINRQALGRPVIRLLADATGQRVAPVEIDLTRDDIAIAGLASPPPTPAQPTAV